MADHLRIISKKAGFRRAGMDHPDTAVFHRIDDLTPVQIDLLKAEPMLIVDELDPPGHKPAPRGGKGKGEPDTPPPPPAKD